MSKCNMSEQIHDWQFVTELKSPLHKTIIWDRSVPEYNEADLSNGVSLLFNFPATDTLETACKDFENFLKAGNINQSGKFKIITEKITTSCFEEYSIKISSDACVISANDTEGIRRGLVWVEDAIRMTGGPFIKIGTVTRRPFIKTRISRCFFSPIKRPPTNRDELVDDINYYPDEYLNRLAHEGVNGLWLSVAFKDLCPSKYFPEHGVDRKKRIEKLRKTVSQCARYGIKVYLFCIEPVGFGKSPSDLLSPSFLTQVPFLAGHKAAENYHFCTSTSMGQEYLEECCYYIFSKVSGLGGLINIGHGERPTNCYSYSENFFTNNCPRCSKRKPWEVFRDTASAMRRGIARANPAAEMIFWLYIPKLNNLDGYSVESKKRVIKEIAAHMPNDVIFQYNFESNGVVQQLNKPRLVLDYYLSWPGPSQIFKDCTTSVLKNGTRGSAKIQVGCSHEIATIPFIPVPGNLYKKYQAMHKLGLDTVMQCWYFGNYPGLMNKAAGELSFEPFYGSEDEFLSRLAQIDWGRDAQLLLQVWKYFQESYSNFPINLAFTWFGPVHDAVVWPLYLFPVDKPIAPSWEFGYPPSGDRIGECICFDHSLKEILILLKRMVKLWRKGVELLQDIKKKYINIPERLKDIELAEAIYLQMTSAYNVIKFYELREKLPFRPSNAQLRIFNTMNSIVLHEIDNSLDLIKLCDKDSRLGFHSEAEGYKYSSAKLGQRVIALRELLDSDFPKLKLKIDNGEALFPDYTGQKMSGKIYLCHKVPQVDKWEKITKNVRWQAYYDRDNIYFVLKADHLECSRDNRFEIEIEPERLWPAMRFIVSTDGNKLSYNCKQYCDNRWDAKVWCDKSWHIKFKIPFESICKTVSPAALRINISLLDDYKTVASWVSKVPLPNRLIFGDYNPKCLGWLVFEDVK